LLKRIWEKYDQWIVGVIFFILGFMARGLWNLLTQLPVIGVLFK